MPDAPNIQNLCNNVWSLNYYNCAALHAPRMLALKSSPVIIDSPCGYLTPNSTPIGHARNIRAIEPGDTVLADKGFDITEDIGLHGGQLAIPAFTRGKSQLTQKEVEFSHRLAKVRIHVERVIGLMKNKYTLLQGTLPVSLMKHIYS